MDELFIVEKCIGEVAGVINLSSKAEATNFVQDKWEEFEAPVVEEK